MRKLTIYRRYFYNNDCYKGAYKQQSCAIQVHSTGANNPNLCRYVQPDDGRLGKNKYGNDSNRSGTTVCASAYIGKLEDGTVAVYQTLPWDYRCWLSGSSMNGSGNKLGYVGFEICEDSKQNAEYFNTAVMEVSVNLTAYLCMLFGTNPYKIVKQFAQGDALAVMDHSELHGLKLASNHGDITHWLKIYGLRMSDYRDAVLKAMQEGVEVTYVDCDTGAEETSEQIDKSGIDTPALYLAEVTSTGSYLNLRQSKSTNSTSLKKLYKGSIVEILDDSDKTWWKIRSEGVVGYAMHDSGTTVWLTPQKAATEEPASIWTVTVEGLTLAAAQEIISKYGGKAVRQE